MARSFQRVLSALLFSALIPGSAHGVEPLWFDAPPPPRRARALTTDFLAPLAAEALPAVVMLSVTGPVHHHEDSTRSHPKKSSGAAFILTPAGLILTNEHLVRDATSIRAELHDGRQFDAQVVGGDSATDVALLQINATNLPILKLGDSTTLRVGDWVMTIGKPASMAFTTTAGIVSALHRRNIHPGAHLKYADFIQTDAAFNKGSSGGPLVNIHGAVVGMATAMKHTAQDIGYAIPVSRLKPLIERIHRGPIQRSWVGMRLEALGNGEPGVRITQVIPGGPASRTDIAPGDVILSLNGHASNHPEDIRWEVSLSPANIPITLSRLRDNEILPIQVTPERLPHAQSERAHPSSPDTPSTDRWGFTLSEPGEARVLVIVEEGAADTGGLREGDVVVRVGHDAVKNAAEAIGAVDASGSSLELEILREGERLYIVLGDPR